MSSRPSVFVLHQPALIIAGLFSLLSLGAGADKKGTVANAASSAGPQVPVVGFVAQDSARLRPVVGAVGAAVFGDALGLKDSVVALSISPAGTFAIAERSDAQPLSVLPIGPDAVGEMQPMAGALQHSDRIEFSASGSAAAVYSASRQRIQMIGNLPDSATLKQEVDVSPLNAPVTAMAINDDASMLLAGVSDGQSGAVYRFTADNALTNIFTTPSASALRFVPQSDSALLADSQLNQILLLSTLSGATAAKQLAGADQGASGPNQIEVLADNRTAVIGNSSASSLLLIDLQLGTSASLPIFAPVVSMRAVQMRSGVALSTSGPAAYWLLGGESARPILTMIADPGLVANTQ